MATDLPKLAAPARRALAGIGVQHLEDLANYSRAEILALHGMGKNAIEQIEAALMASGLAFRKE